MAMIYAFDREYFQDTLLHGNGVGTPLPMYHTCKDYPAAYAETLKYNLET